MPDYLDQLIFTYYFHCSLMTALALKKAKKNEHEKLKNFVFNILNILYFNSI